MKYKGNCHKAITRPKIKLDISAFHLNSNLTKANPLQPYSSPKGPPNKKISRVKDINNCHGRALLRIYKPSIGIINKKDRRANSGIKKIAGINQIVLKLVLIPFINNKRSWFFPNLIYVTMIAAIKGPKTAKSLRYNHISKHSIPKFNNTFGSHKPQDQINAIQKNSSKFFLIRSDIFLWIFYWFMVI
ncbi:MAG: hypothetical protein BAJALOKI3v1_760010 [Promethearchaeota archaeon]|nr:MAG: hypothetical protein BAJALOKI3v1_760010 [Candidatus Lokiarchaeota archaeon]